MAEKDELIMSIKLKSGAFESNLSMPFPMAPDEMNVFADRWVSMMRDAFSMNVSYQKTEWEKRK